MRIERDFKCCGGHNCCACLGACAMTLRVESPPGTLIGSVQQKLSCCSPTFSVLDSQENEILQIVGPACMLCPQFCDIEFEVSLRSYCYFPPILPYGKRIYCQLHFFTNFAMF